MRIVSGVHLHAMTTIHDGKTLRSLSLQVATDYLALGLDPDRAVIYRQSDVPPVTELAWMLSTVTPMGLLQRGHSYKDKIARGITPTHGLFSAFSWTRFARPGCVARSCGETPASSNRCLGRGATGPGPRLVR